MNILPPDWFEGAKDGDEVEKEGVRWYVREIEVDTIYWSVTRYGRIMATSTRRQGI